MYNDRIFRVSRQHDILGQKELYIRNAHCIWLLSCTEDKLLGKCSLDRGETWSKWLELVPHYNGFFSFTISEVEKLHFICKNKAGDLVYVCWHGVKVETDILKEDVNITYHSVLVDNLGTVHIIYFTYSFEEEVWKAYHCFKSKSQWSSAKLFATGTGHSQNHVAVALDNTGTIHLVHHSSQSQFVYRSYNRNNGLWSNPLVITASSGSNLYPCLVCDELNILHLTWLRFDGMNYRVMYKRKKSGGWPVGEWQQERFLSRPGVNAYTPIIGVWGERVLVLWQQVEGIYECTSLDSGNTFNEPVLNEHGYDLVNLCHNQIETEEINRLLPEKKPKSDVTCPEPVSSKLAYGQNEFSENLVQNFRRLFFEMEDWRLYNVQVKDAIVEQDQQIRDLVTEIMKLMEKISSVERVVQSLVVRELKMKSRLAQHEMIIKELMQELKSLKREFEVEKNTPFWKKLGKQV